MPASRLTSKKEKGIAVLITALCLLLVVPTVGLAIDAGVLYAVRARLSAAVDAASVAAARSLHVGITLEDQRDSAIARAQAFFAANFPDGTFGASNTQVAVEVAESGLRTRTVEVRASVEVPTYFMRMIGPVETTVAALGEASRRDVNLILVLDRSGSMQNTGSCVPMREAARTFVSKFANGRDRLGLITFGLTYLLAYAPDKDFMTSSPNLDNVLSNITCSGGTNPSQALSRAYEQFQLLNEPGALNLVVFFTDGLPTGFTAEFPVKMETDTRYGTGSSYNYTYTYEPSPCRDSNNERYDRRPWQSSRTYYAPNWNPNWFNYDPLPTKRGTIVATGNADTPRGYTLGIMREQAISLNDHNEDSNDVITDSAGCDFAANGWTNMRRDVAFIPGQDAFGNSTSGYANGTVSGRTFGSGPYAGQLRPDKPDVIGMVAKNTADNVATAMRQDADLEIMIYAIGLGDTTGTYTPPDEVFMRRVSNDPASPIFTDTEPIGLYVFAANNAELNQAFARVASEILRISQ